MKLPLNDKKQEIIVAFIAKKKDIGNSSISWHSLGLDIKKYFVRGLPQKFKSGAVGVSCLLACSEEQVMLYVLVAMLASHQVEPWTAKKQGQSLRVV